MTVRLQVMRKIMVLGLALLGVGLVAAWFFARPAYRRYEERRAVEEAKEFLAKRDFKNASLSARRALTVNPRDVEPCRIIAELADMSGAPAALEWWGRVAQLSPTVADRLRLASAALRYQPPPFALAARTLKGLAHAAGREAAYHSLLGQLDLKRNRLAAATQEFERAVELEPTNQFHQLNLAVLRLASTNQAIAAQGRQSLEQLRTSPTLGAVALRSLIADSLKGKNLARARQFSDQVLKTPQASLDDRLQHAAILRQMKDPEFETDLLSIQKRVSTNALAIYATTTWMIGQRLAAQAGSWLKSLPSRLRAQQPVPLAVVDCYEAQEDWPGLETYLQGQQWNDMEFMRYALLSRAAAKQHETVTVQSRWDTAVRQAGDRIDALKALLNLAAKWGWEKDRDHLLWQILQRFPRERWTLMDLQQSYMRVGDTRGLNNVFTAMATYNPSNFVALNNLAATSLLLKTNLPQAYNMAKEAFLHYPTNATIASTYAFSLYCQGKTHQGLAVLQQIDPKALQTPSVALYYGVLLSRAGESGEAQKYLGLARKSHLLPEEQTLLRDCTEPARK